MSNYVFEFSVINMTTTEMSMDIIVAKGIIKPIVMVRNVFPYIDGWKNFN